MLDRRQVLGLFGAAGAVAALGWPMVSAGRPASSPRLVVVLLRGGLDGLHAVIPHGDPAYSSIRGRLAIEPEERIGLDGMFGLHPALRPIAGWFDEGHLLPLHALGLPYQQRSHFDAQDVLDNGSDRPNGRHDGWLNRALGHLPGASGIAVGQTVPLVLRGPTPVQALDPRRTRAAHPSLLDRLEQMYALDPALGQALKAGRESLTLLPDTPVEGRGRGFGERVVGTLANAAVHPSGPTAVVLELGGWDTHANQGGARGQLANRLGDLARGLAGLRASLGAAWEATTIVVLTEFGRTAAPNGTGGTDHGVGSAGFLAGGAVAGGRVLADWPGLSRKALLDGRDLRPTLDARAVLAGVLRDHVGLGHDGLAETFPGFDVRGAVGGLIRGV